MYEGNLRCQVKSLTFGFLTCLPRLILACSVPRLESPDTCFARRASQYVQRRVPFGPRQRSV